MYLPGASWEANRPDQLPQGSYALGGGEQTLPPELTDEPQVEYEVVLGEMHMAQGPGWLCAQR